MHFLLTVTIGINDTNQAKCINEIRALNRKLKFLTICSAKVSKKEETACLISHYFLQRSAFPEIKILLQEIRLFQSPFNNFK